MDPGSGAKRPAASPPSPSVSQLGKVSRTSDNMGDGEDPYESAPAYFQAWMKECRDRENVRDAAYDKRFNEISEQIVSTSKSTDSKLAGMDNRISAVSHTLILTDSCEIKITGIPSSINCSLLEAAQRVFHAIDCAACSYHIIEVRQWKDKKPSSNPPTDSNPNPPPGGAQTISIVVKLAAPNIRDTIRWSASLLNKTNAKEIFGAETESKIFLNPLWPKPIYILLAKARAAAKTLHYATPDVRNLVVCMRKSRGAPWIPIHSEADLTALAPCARTPM